MIIIPFFFDIILTLFEKYCYYLILFNNSIPNVISNFKSFTIFDFNVEIKYVFSKTIKSFKITTHFLSTCHCFKIANLTVNKNDASFF